ncbi:MAG: pectinesterase family protein [Porphyromonadaceae bacterium]|nr:pectinesterase family protein [Porphyromonadaceae bacterium]
MAALLFITAGPMYSKIEGSLDPESVVSQWSDSSAFPKVIDMNFSDTMWPDTWKGETGRECPSYDDGGYVNAVLETPANGGSEITYPVLFHLCTFATKESYNGYAGATAAFCRQYYLGENPSGNSASTYNNWTVEGHTAYLEDNLQYGSDGNPIYGEAGFVQMCRDAGVVDATTNQNVSLHGWVEIDHIPYVERIQWSWSSTSWGRGIKCDVKIGDGDWSPLVWMGSEKQKSGYTVFSDQGYFMENVIDAYDVSLRWRVWDGDTSVQLDEEGSPVFSVPIDSMAQKQAPRLHKIQVFGNYITEEEAEYARENPVSDVGELSDLDDGNEGTTDTAPDADAPIVLAVVAQDGTGDYTTIQEAIDAVPAGSRGIIYIRPGTYAENLYAGTKSGEEKYISLIGENKETTLLTSSVSRGTGNESNTYNDCAALNVYVDRFYAENLTICNTSGDVGQAEALYTQGDAHIFNNCRISGYQDTYKANVGARGYFNNCTLEGATDFIYDSGLEWFEGCTINCVKGGGYITAAGEAGLSLTNVLYPELSVSPFYAGLFFHNCTVTAEDGVSDGAYYLGRPWKEKCGTMFLQCTFDSHINDAGWLAWNGNEDDCSYVEYHNVDSNGNLVSTSSRASFSYQATDAEVEAYMNPEFLFGTLSDVPFDYTKILNGAASPSHFTVSDTGFTWESDDMAAGYLLYKDGEFVAFVEEPSYSKGADDESVYKVRSVSRHGVTSAAVTAAESTQLLAFPTAEGFGKYATGGRGGQVVKVTSLEDTNDAGTLRWAFNQYPDEPLTIEFSVSGEICLTSELRVNRTDWTLAGQTAPGEGIVITHNKVNLGGSENFIVRNVRFRIGQKSTGGDVLMENALGAENCYNFIFDHCTFGWSVEENMNTADSHFLTVQYSIIHEGLYNAGHSKGARGYGSQWGGSPATYHHNLLCHNNSRSPRFNGARGEDYVVFLEYINNVNYNWGSTGACYGGENTADISSYNGLNSVHECNFMNNYYKPGPESPSGSVFVSSSYARDGATSWGPAKWYIDGNIMEGNSTANADNWTAVTAETYSLDQIRADERIVTETPYYKYTLVGNVGTYDPERYMLYDFESADDAYNTVVNTAGTINRDTVEQRIANDVINGTAQNTGSVSNRKGIIDLESDAEGFFDYSTEYTVPVDTDEDGMPDDWETAHGLDPNVADQNTLNAEGYTALEVYLNSLMGEEVNDDFTSSIGNVVMERPDISYDRLNNILRVSDNALGSTLKVYFTDGRLLMTRLISSSEVLLPDLPMGVMLMQVSGNNLCPRILKVVK